MSLWVNYSIKDCLYIISYICFDEFGKLNTKLINDFFTYRFHQPVKTWTSMDFGFNGRKKGH